MAKTYCLPSLNEELLKQIAAAGLKLSRNSKACITLSPIEDESMQYKRYYVFHIDFAARIVDGMNINEYTSNYKRATIWVKTSEMQLLIAIEKELNRLLEIGEFLA